MYSRLILFHCCTVVITFQLSQPEYRVMEGDTAVMPVITKDLNVFIANPVTFNIFPLTVDQALGESVISSFEQLDIFSPNRAG